MCGLYLLILNIQPHYRCIPVILWILLYCVSLFLLGSKILWCINLCCDFHSKLFKVFFYLMGLFLSVLFIPLTHWWLVLLLSLPLTVMFLLVCLHLRFFFLLYWSLVGCLLQSIIARAYFYMWLVSHMYRPGCTIGYSPWFA